MVYVITEAGPTNRRAAVTDDQPQTTFQPSQRAATFTLDPFQVDVSVLPFLLIFVL
jgi:hypothetical protein